MERTFTNGQVKDCCKVVENLELLTDESRNGLAVKRCKVCGCRHRRLTLEPGMLGMTILPLGKRAA